MGKWTKNNKGDVIMEQLNDNSIKRSELDPEFLKFMEKEWIKKKKLEEVENDMQQMMQDHHNNISDFQNKYDGNPSRHWALLLYRKYCIKKGIDYKEDGTGKPNS